MCSTYLLATHALLATYAAKNAPKHLYPTIRKYIVKVVLCGFQKSLIVSSRVEPLHCPYKAMNLQGDDAGLDRVAALLFNKQESR